MRSILNMVLISFSCYPACARLWYVISSEMQWRETGHDALRCVRRIVLLNAGLAVHARIHMHDWYGARVLSIFECPDDRTAKFSGAIRPARLHPGRDRDEGPGDGRPRAARRHLLRHSYSRFCSPEALFLRKSATTCTKSLESQVAAECDMV